MNKIQNNKLYFSLTAILFCLTSVLNATNKLIICSFILVALALTANSISELFGKAKAVTSIILSLLVATILSWNIKYYIHGIKVDIILLGSFTAVLLSTYSSMIIVSKLKANYSFIARNFLGLIAASIMDSAIMGTVLSTRFSVNKVFSIFVKDVAFKFVYSLTATLLLWTVFYILEQVKVKKV